MLKAASTKFYRNLVLEILQRGRRGTLRLKMPGGATRIFGGLDKELHAEINITHEAFYRRWVLFGLIGLAESYLHGEWETENLTQVIAWFFLNNDFLSKQKTKGQGFEKYNLLGIVHQFQHFLHSRHQKKKCTYFYDEQEANTSFFKEWLDPSMAYSAAYYQDPSDSLASAQEAKWNHLGEKLRLTQHDYLLDIGCGWGGFAIHAAKKYGCRVQAATICEEQFRQAAMRVEEEGVASLVEVVFCDDQHLSGRFDKIACIEMIDTFSNRDFEPFFAKIENLLAPQGLFLLQTALAPDNHYPLLRENVDFIQKYILPRSLTPSLRRITEACNTTGNLNLLDCEDITPSAARTFASWREMFIAKLPKMQDQGYSPLFLRKWFYYLSYCEAGLATRSRTAIQAVYTRPMNLELTRTRI